MENQDSQQSGAEGGRGPSGVHTPVTTMNQEPMREVSNEMYKVNTDLSCKRRLP